MTERLNCSAAWDYDDVLLWCELRVHEAPTNHQVMGQDGSGHMFLLTWYQKVEED